MQCKKSTTIFPWAQSSSPVGERKSEPATVGVLVWACVWACCCRGFDLGWLVCVQVYHLSLVGNVWSSHGNITSLAVRTAFKTWLRLCWELHCARSPLSEDFTHITQWVVTHITSILKILPGQDGRGQGDPHPPSPTSNPNLQVSWPLRR